MNSSLYNKPIELPKEIKEYLQTCFDMFPNSDSSIEGHKRNEELRNSGYATYQQLGRMKSWFVSLFTPTASMALVPKPKFSSKALPPL